MYARLSRTIATVLSHHFVGELAEGEVSFVWNLWGVRDVKILLPGPFVADRLFNLTS